MREIHVDSVIKAVRQMCITANCNLHRDLADTIQFACDKEESLLGRQILNSLLENAKIARDRQMPICQDTGMAVVFVEVGQDVHVIGGQLGEAINEGVRQGYVEGYLRKSVVADPLVRVNTGDNTPAVIHYDIVPGDKLHIKLAPKGFGSENMSKIKMLKPSDGIKGVEDFVIDTVDQAGANPCPPIIVGVGIGGTFEKAALLAKKALLRPLGISNPQRHLAELESRLLTKINNLGIGPQGLGGITTALKVHVETYPTHIAGLPVAVNINCHVSRHEQVIL